MIRNKRGMMDDFFDFIFTVFVAFFLLLFVGVLVGNSSSDSTFITEILIERTDAVHSTIITQRAHLEQGEAIDVDSMNRAIQGYRTIEINSDGGVEG